jgi:hypothetical protein
MRQRHETEADLERERQAASKFSRRRKCVLHKLPIFYEIDYLIEFQGLIRGVLEVKCRDFHSYDYGTIFLSLHKYKALCEYGRLVGGTADLVVQLRDKMLTANLLSYHPSSMRIAFGGRTDREEPQDQEPVLHIPIDWFIEVTE